MLPASCRRTLGWELGRKLTYSARLLAALCTLPCSYTENAMLAFGWRSRPDQGSRAASNRLAALGVGAPGRAKRHELILAIVSLPGPDNQRDVVMVDDPDDRACRLMTDLDGFRWWSAPSPLSDGQRVDGARHECNRAVNFARVIGNVAKESRASAVAVIETPPKRSQEVRRRRSSKRSWRTGVESSSTTWSW
jgi:hypothetical protein